MSIESTNMNMHMNIGDFDIVSIDEKIKRNIRIDETSTTTILTLSSGAQVILRKEFSHQGAEMEQAPK
jgi:hypothetical protein